MQIGKNWKIEAETLNVTILRRVERKKRATGEKYEDWEVVGFYSTVKSALHGLVERGVRDTELKDVRTVVAAIEKMHKDIDNGVQ